MIPLTTRPLSHKCSPNLLHCMLTTPTLSLVKTSLNALWNLKLAKKSLVNDKVTIPWSTRYASYAHYIHHSKQQKMNLRKLLGQQGFKTVKCNSFQSSSSLSVCTFLLYLPWSLNFQGCALHCSRAWWPLVPNFCSWASRKSYKSYAGHLGFYRFRALGSLQFFLEQSLDFLLMFWSFIFMFHSTWWQFLCFTM